jgi:hypothetical protein
MGDDAASSKALTAADAARLLLELHQENTTFVRHYEEIRFKYSQLVVTLGAALVGLSRFAQLPPQSLAVSKTIPFYIMFLAISGVLISLKYTERADRHATISRAYRRACSDVVAASTSIDIELLHRSAAERHNNIGPLARVMHLVRARTFWVIIHPLLASFGFIMLLTPHLLR